MHRSRRDSAPLEVDEFDIVRPGEDTGMRPLDGDLFDSRPPPRKKGDKKWLGATAPPPMAYSEQVVSRRFKFGIKDLILVVLILILTAGLVLGWFIYQDYRDRQSLKEAMRDAELIEKSKDQAIQGSTKKKDGEIPYKDKIEKPKGGKK